MVYGAPLTRALVVDEPKDIVKVFDQTREAVDRNDLDRRPVLSTGEASEYIPHSFAHTQSLLRATDVAVMIHKAHGRDEVAAEAAEIASRFTAN